jgi:ATP-dependent Lhr-like helicase
MFGVRWRWDATRALAIPRMWRGRRMPPSIARMRAEDLLAAVFPQAVACQDNAPAGPVDPPDHPLVREALRDCLHEAMDAGGLARLLARIEAGEVRLLAVDTAEPSPLCHEIVGARPWAYLDDAPLEERRARAVAVRRALPAEEARTIGALDPAAAAEVAAQVWPDVRDAEELHDALLDLVVLPAEDAWEPLLADLVRAGRAAVTVREGRAYWVAAERVPVARALGLAVALAPPRGAAASPSPHEALCRVLKGWLPRVGPTTAALLAARVGLPEPLVAEGLRMVELEGLALRGRFLPDAPWSEEAPHWCERGVLARIHRATLATLRREIEPVGVADLVRFLVRWQRAMPGARLHGPRGVAEAVAQLQGFHAPAGAWEHELLPARVAGYDPAWLDGLCLSGEIAWGRLSVAADPEEGPRRRAAPSRNAPIALALRQDLGWLAAAGGAAAPLGPDAAAIVALLSRRGALFLAELAAGAGRTVGDLEPALWELVSAGAVTCDAFAGLRALLDHAPRHGRRRAAAVGGRWSLLARDERRDDLVERVAAQLLRRWGVVFRDLLAREAAAPPWRELVRVYRRLEARGELRGGRFVSGFSGEQFALPDAVPALRAVRRAPRDGRERVDLSAADPLNLAGVVLPGPRVAAVLGGRVVYVDGVPAHGPEGSRGSSPTASPGAPQPGA